MIALLTGIVGLITTFLAWKFNPKRILLSELDHIDEEKNKWEGVRDEALSKNDVDNLTVAIAKLLQLRERKADLLQRFR